MKRQLGINSSCIQNADPAQTLSIIKETGFSCFFSDYSNRESIRTQKSRAVQLGLDFQFIHAPFMGCNDFWLAGDKYKPLFDSVTDTIDAAAENDVNAVIVHVSSGFTPPPVNDLGLSRFDALVEHSEKRGVVLAFENLRKLGNLACLMDRYENNPFVKNCYDCGHEHCYTVHVPFVEIFDKRLYCTHLHDNFGRPDDGDGDLHLLPFDGNIDYKNMIARLNKIGYQGSLMLEVFNHRQYRDMKAEAFIQTAYERALKLSKL